MSASDFETLHEIVGRARQNLDQNSWDYIVGGTETETTLRRNRLALDSVALRHRVLRNVSKVDASVDRLGRKLRLPVVLAPIGSLESFQAGGAAPAARAAGKFGVPHMLSSACDPDLEQVAAEAPDALRMFQLYARGDDDWVDEHVRRAMTCGCSAFFLTVDTAIYTRRERDICKRYVTLGRRRASGEEFQAALDWRTVARLKNKFDMPLGLKGIGDAEDALVALDHGVDFIYISNHGGRQLDHDRGSFEMLPEIADAAQGRATIIVDGGFCRGTDIVKGIAAGADLIGLGRMQCYGLAAAGEAGVVRMLELLEDEVRRTLGLVGATRMTDVSRASLAPAQPTNLPSVLSAFPLLKLDDDFAY